jgi:RNA recognition motif-containing protein
MTESLACYTVICLSDRSAFPAFRIRSELLASPAFRPSIPLEPVIRFTRIDGMQESFMSTKLYVGNLPYETSESDLQTLFESSGPVASINIVRDRATGQARGFAFVEMSDTEGARKAISELDKHQYGGRSLTVNEAKPMQPRSGGFGGGGRQRSESRW